MINYVMINNNYYINEANNFIRSSCNIYTEKYNDINKFIPYLSTFKKDFIK